MFNGVDGCTSLRWPTFVQRRWFTLGYSPQMTRVNKQVTTCSPVYNVLFHCVFSALNLVSQFCQTLSNYGVQMEGWSHTACARYITQTRMFVECKIGKLQKPNHSVKDIGVNGETAKYSWFNSRRCETTNQKNFLNSHILQQNLPAQLYLPPFWNQLPGSILWNRANSIVQPLNTNSLIQSCWSNWDRVNAP